MWSTLVTHSTRFALLRSEDVFLQLLTLLRRALLSPLCCAQAICTEAGLLALRERRMKVTQKDFRSAKETALYKKQANIPEGLFL